LEDSRIETLQTLTDLANRIKMQKVRAATRHADASRDDPDPFKNPDEWRSMMNKRLAAAKFNGGQP
jgi:hypothetical protein